MKRGGIGRESTFKIVKERHGIIVVIPIARDPFFTFCKGNSSVPFWKELIQYIEKTLTTQHYQLKITLTQSTFEVLVRYGKPGGGPVESKQCMSCDLECPLESGLGREGKSGLVGEGEKEQKQASLLAKDTLVLAEENVRCWLDGKARYMIVVTPLKHITALNQMSDVLLKQFWMEGISTFRDIILNHGKYKNHDHLHMKISLSGEEFFRKKDSWPENMKDIWNKLSEFNKPKIEEIQQSPYASKASLYVADYTHKNNQDKINLLVSQLKSYGKITNFKERGYDALEVTFQNPDDAARCMVESYRMKVGDHYPTFHWNKH
eukprot:TRINITY_DN7049_c0_g2_i1.p1 TRINITY_DN7049_c0_g2~~TRINITY_DN7049_c0_g2_i1.p1  ORF type:complete len:320 (+),score=78.05 TRINITY_DN7049_c0_g2_i1:44-1003(+)